MEDIMLIKYLKDKGILNIQEYNELISKDTKHSNNPVQVNKSDKYSEFFDNFKEVTKDMNISEKAQFVDRLKDYNNSPVEHFNESYAKYIVSKMWHKDISGRKYMGEKYDISKAKEIYERYRGIIPTSFTYSDVYVAINTQYHSYHCLFTKWFGEDVDYQIIESAIMYWFKDENQGPSKLWNHFIEK